MIADFQERYGCALVVRAREVCDETDIRSGDAKAGPMLAVAGSFHTVLRNDGPADAVADFKGAEAGLRVGAIVHQDAAYT